ncbi:class I SAM-dependent RNA methyltransferase [Pikeienuella piscinae]|uniref:Class I SAM-dependent RNA methyltransferase n=1 Tax=Pikeienuella piscinae TaxID=2748098 RepID=A0A7M3T572_9RHOB|nr:class I SAM-dependent RNA methyltransferase [Pikeienuella piscinae]QIE57153.1 class I SAM-dependent RNA methyltransferase [Pikeienuella piscinae]
MKTIIIDRLAAEGDGQGDGVFAPFTLPGERVRGAVTDGRMATPEILTRSPHRTTPPCPHFGACGGCALQHADDALLVAWKRDRIAEALRARGIGGVEIRETITSPPRSRRRAGFSARRTRKTVIAGFHERAGDVIVEVERCEVVAPALLGALGAVRGAARLGASRQGEIRGVATLADAGVDLAIAEAKPLDRAGLLAAAALAADHDLARLSWNGEIIAERRPPTQRFGTALVTPPPGAFLQATKEGEAALLSATREAIGRSKRIGDLFAGCGTFSLPLADSAEVLAIEGEAAMLDAMQTGWRNTAGLKKLVAIRRDLFRRPLTSHELTGLDAVVIDPPRAGAAMQSAELAKGGPPRVAALSCNPATFARDARLLIDGGYRLDWVQPVDQFRWSPHVEIAARFSRD